MDVAVRAATGINQSGGLIAPSEQFLEKLMSEESCSGYLAESVPDATPKSISTSKSVVEVTHWTLPALFVTSNTSVDHTWSIPKRDVGEVLEKC